MLRFRRHRKGGTGGKGDYALLVGAAAIAPFALLYLLVPVGLVLPIYSILALSAAGMAALAASVSRRMSGSSHSGLWETAGALAFVGFAAGMLSEPENVLRFWTRP